MSMKIKITSMHYHRNGVFGTGFFVVQFRHAKYNMIAVVFPNLGDIAVLSEIPTERWRGDQFEAAIRAYIAEHDHDKEPYQ
jgi:hypothetical protein